MLAAFFLLGSSISKFLAALARKRVDEGAGEDGAEAEGKGIEGVEEEVGEEWAL